MTARHSSIRYRLFLLAAAGVFPLAVMTGIALVILADDQRAQVRRVEIDVAVALTTAIDGELDRSFSVLEALSNLTLSDALDLRRFHDLLRRALPTQGNWIAVNLAEPSGRQVLNTDYEYGAPLANVIESESFARAVQTRRRTIGYVAKGPLGRYAVPVRVPVIYDGELKYILTAVIDPSAFTAVLDRQRLPGDWVASVFDAHRLRVARSRLHEKYVGTAPSPSLAALMDKDPNQGFGVTEALEGDAVDAVYYRSPKSGWTVAIGLPQSVARAGALQSFLTFGGGLVIAIVLGGIAALVAARSITRPMNELLDAARAVGHRQSAKPVDTDIQEIRDVATALQTAAAGRSAYEVQREQLLDRANEARALAETASRAKDEFLAMLGHELRNPLGAIANARHLLDNPRANAAAHAHAKEVIGRQVDHLSRMTDDLLDAARATTSKIVLQKTSIDLAHCASQAIAALKASGRAANHSITETLEHVWINADATRIEQMVVNLLGNAVKYTPPNGTIVVDVRREGDDAVLRVRDDGAGMPADLVPRVFEAFVQGDSALDRSLGGLGLGLTLVRRLAELHGGTATASSAGPGKGSTFTVRLPAIAASDARETATIAANGGTSRNVLVVDDNRDVRESLRAMLELDGHDVRAVGDAAAALDVLRSWRAEVSLIDIGLPRIDGYALAQTIRSEFSADTRPRLVAVTGYGATEDRRRSRDAGFDLHLVKPVDVKALQSVMEEG